MAKVDGFVEFVAEAADGIAALFNSRGDSFVDLETAEYKVETDPQTHKEIIKDIGVLVRPDGTLVSLIQIRGTRKVVGAAELAQFSRNSMRMLNNPMTRVGHQVDIVFRRDDDTIGQEIQRALNPAYKTADRLGLDVGWILDAKRDTLSSWCSSEGCWIALSTDYRIFSSVERKAASKEREKKIKGNPQAKDSMNMATGPSSMVAAHLAMLSSLMQGLDSAYVFATRLSSHQSLQVIRREFDSEATAETWRPWLPGDPIPRRVAQSVNKNDLTSVTYPALRQQLVPRAPGEIINNRWIPIGDRVHAPVVMELPPQDPTTFDGLLRPLIESQTPFRISITLMPDGLSFVSSLRSAISSVLSFVSSVNRQYNQAIEVLKKEAESGVTLVGMRIIADTWVKGSPNNEDVINRLRNRSEYLQKAIQSWGQADTSDVSGDPLQGVAATIPGLTRDNPAPVSIPPLEDVIPMLPLMRPASAWTSGALLFRTPDGRLLPYQPGSSLQTSWVTLGFAPMGKGKSVLLNAHNLALALLEGLDRLPYISILDIGMSSSGLIALLRYSLPESQRYLAVHRRLQNRIEDAINPFETPLGMRRPLPEHRAMLENLLVTLATPEGEKSAQDGISGIASVVVDLVFDAAQADNKPKRYDPRQDPEIARVVEEKGINIDAHTTWWEIEDALFELGLIDFATRAHSFAMPLLSDCAQAANHSAVTSVYKGQTSSRESMSEYFWRMINEAIGRYPILSAPTRFNIGAAKIVALDLSAVCPKGSASADKQTGIMYSLARYALAQRFFMDEDSIPYFEPLYRNYWSDHVKLLKGEPKLLCADEFHRTRGVEGVRKQFVTDIREGRKFGVQIALFSQDVGDFDDEMIRLSTTRFALGADTPDAAQEVVDRFELTPSAKDILLNRITRPGPQGAGMYISTRSKFGSSEMFAYLSLGPIEMWAFDSSAKNRALRDQLYDRIGVRRTLTMLAHRFPSGSAEEEIDRRRSAMGVREEGEEGGVIEQMVREIEAMAMAA